MSVANTSSFHEVQPSQLCLFDLPGYQTAVENVSYQKIRPISTISADSPIEFNIAAQNDLTYMDLKRSTMFVKVRITKNDGSKIDSSNNNVGPINLLLHSLFSQVDVFVQNRLVSSSTGNYAYKAYIQNLLKYGKSSKQTQFTAQLWYEDTPGAFDDYNVSEGSNLGLYHRFKFLENGRSVDLQGNICHPLFSMDRYLLNLVSVDVKFYRNRPEFYLLTGDDSTDYKIEIQDMYLNICKVNVSNGLFVGHQNVLKSQITAKYPYVNTEVKIISIPSGQITFAQNNIFPQARPSKVVVAFASSKSAAGDFKLSPYNFKHYNLNQIALKVDGIPVPGSVSNISYSSTNGNLCIPAFYNLYDIAGKALNDEDNGIDRGDFGSGYALYAFNIEPDFDNLNYLSLIKKGTVSIEAHFSRPIEESVCCVIYSEGNGLFELDESRSVTILE